MAFGFVRDLSCQGGEKEKREGVRRTHWWSQHTINALNWLSDLDGIEVCSEFGQTCVPRISLELKIPLLEFSLLIFAAWK